LILIGPEWIGKTTFLHDFVADKIDAFDLYINSRAKWKKWPYKKCQLKKSSLDWEQI
jgi:hypothetical protein